MNKNKLYITITILGCVAILTIAGLVINQTHKNYQASQLVIEKCFENFDEVKEVVIIKDSFWSPVTCERK